MPLAKAMMEAAGNSTQPTYIEDVFSTHLYTGTNSTQTINNGIDLAGKGGLVWLKWRNDVADHALYDTNRGAYKQLRTSSTLAEYNDFPAGVSAFNATGFNVSGANGSTNASGNTYASWTFRKQPKFFDVVTYTGNNAARTIAHSLGSAPGCIIIKPIDSAVQNNWVVYHQSLGNTSCAFLNLTDAAASGVGSYWNSTTPTSTVFSLGTANATNQTGINYVAYLFAHNAGGFGLTGTDNVISCGSYTGTGASFGPQVDLGFEPQFVMIKAATTTGSWAMFDNMRGIQVSGPDQRLYANTSDAEATTGGNGIEINATGFRANETFSYINGSGQTYIYIAIRRGPMKTPTSGTSVFSVDANGNTSVPSFTSAFPVDLAMMHKRSTAADGFAYDRLRGNLALFPNLTSAESSSNAAFDQMNGWGGSTGLTDWVSWMFRRAPGFFDEVCWTGDGTGNARNHNLAVYPELVISKLRSGGAGFGAWNVQNNINPSAKQTGFLNTTAAFSSSGATSPTANVFYPTDDQSGATYVTYLFASCPGVSKVGSYTGNGSTQTIDCGFTGGARFVLIKSTNVSGDWWVFDTARGITSTSDAGLMLNTTGAEIVDEFGIDPATGGFAVKQSGGTLNNSGTNYIYLAIA